MKEKIYSSPLKSYITRNGFIAVSNLLFDKQQELGLSEGELMFIIRIMKNRTSSVVHDDELDPTNSTRTLARRRASLKEKGYLNYSIVKAQDESGLFKTTGIMYDLSPLEDKLQAISDKFEEKKQEKLKEELKETKITQDENLTPLENYKEDYKNTYGIDYTVNELELKQYAKLSENEKKCISYIFEFCKEKNLLGTIVPRLSLFFKAKFRFIELKNYCIQNGYIISDEELELENQIEKEKEEFTKKLDEEEKIVKKYMLIHPYEKYKERTSLNEYAYETCLRRAVHKALGRDGEEQIVNNYVEAFINNNHK